jgi:hypothetical protein
MSRSARRLVLAGLCLVCVVLAVVLVTASASSGPGRLRGRVGDAVNKVGDVLTPPDASPTHAPTVTLDPAEAAAVQRSRAAVPEAQRLLAEVQARLEAGDAATALADFKALLDQLAVIQPRDGRTALDDQANELRDRLQEQLNGPTPTATVTPAR